MTNKIEKIFHGYTKALDDATGIVEAYVSIFGIKDLDNPPDVIDMGAFSKSIHERGPAGVNKIRVLWQHNWNEVIGLPLVITEHSRENLPAELLALYPEATGGLYVKAQFVLEVQRGREAYALYKAGAMDEWSVAFDIIQGTNEEDLVDGSRFRRLKELRLWEFSPVTWGMNPATTTTSVKHLETGDAMAEPHQDALTRAKLRAKILTIEMDLVGK